MSADHPAKPLFDKLAGIAEAQKPVPSWEQFAASSSETRRVIIAIWHAHRHRHIDATLNLMKFVAINGPLGADVAGEFDYDGDGGREHDDYMRDNGMGRRGGFVPLRDIAAPVIAALPIVEAPSVVPEISETVTTSGERS